MKNSMQLFVGILVLSVFVASAAQILLKISANRTYPDRLHEYLNPYVIAGYGMMLLSTFLTMLALKKVPLSWSPLIESCSYIFVSALGFLILKEKFSRRKILGLLVILAGILVFAL